MNYSIIRIPFIEKETIQAKADNFRKKYWGDKIPVDIEKIIELKLGFDAIPVPGLYQLCNTDAFITSNWKAFFIDKDKFNDERYEKRLRFSLAHEMGHFVLHKNIYQGLKIRSLTDFYNFVQKVSQKEYNKIEM